MVVYGLRAFNLGGFYIVSYGLGIYLLNLFIGFLSPQVRTQHTPVRVQQYENAELRRTGVGTACFTSGKQRTNVLLKRPTTKSLSGWLANVRNPCRCGVRNLVWACFLRLLSTLCPAIPVRALNFQLCSLARLRCARHERRYARFLDAAPCVLVADVRVDASLCLTLSTCDPSFTCCSKTQRRKGRCCPPRIAKSTGRSPGKCLNLLHGSML